VEKGEGQLDKEATSYNDCFDAFRLLSSSSSSLLLLKALNNIDLEAILSDYHPQHGGISSHIFKKVTVPGICVCGLTVISKMSPNFSS
jgi:hypothetical protein